MPHWETRSNHIGKLLHHPTSDHQPQGREGASETRKAGGNKNRKGRRQTTRKTRKKTERRGTKTAQAQTKQPRKQTKQRESTHGRPSNKRNQEGGIKGIKSTCLKCVHGRSLGARVPWFEKVILGSAGAIVSSVAGHTPSQ